MVEVAATTTSKVEVVVAGSRPMLEILHLTCDLHDTMSMSDTTLHGRFRIERHLGSNWLLR